MPVGINHQALGTIICASMLSPSLPFGNASQILAIMQNRLLWLSWRKLNGIYAVRTCFVLCNVWNVSYEDAKKKHRSQIGIFIEITPNRIGGGLISQCVCRSHTRDRWLKRLHNWRRQPPSARQRRDDFWLTRRARPLERRTGNSILCGRVHYTLISVRTLSLQFQCIPSPSTPHTTPIFVCVIGLYEIDASARTSIFNYPTGFHSCGPPSWDADVARRCHKIAQFRTDVKGWCEGLEYGGGGGGAGKS